MSGNVGAVKPPSIPRVGLPADELLKMRGRGQEQILEWPSPIMGMDDEGLLVDWHYTDCTVRLHYRRGRYRVASVTTKEPEENANANTD